MARRKRTPAPRRRRRIGAINRSFSAASPLVKYGSVVGGYLIGDKINTPIATAAGDNLDPKILAGLTLAVGAFLAFGPGKSSMPKSIVGGILAGAGLKAALKEFGVVTGYRNVPVLTGYGDVPVIGAGYNPAPSLNGVGAVGGYNVGHASVVGGFPGDGSEGGLNNFD